MMPLHTKDISAGRITLLIAGMVAIMPFSIDAYLPAMAAMAADLNSTVHFLEQSISSFYLGIALGQLIGAPVSDRYGRRIPVAIGLIVFIIASGIITQTDKDTTLIAWRFIQALGAGIAAVNAAAIVRDLFDEVGTARLFANIAVVMMIAPLISPLMGAYLLELFGWQSIFWFLAIYGMTILTLLYVWLPETRDLRRTPISKNGYQHVLSSPWSNMLALCLAFSSVCFFLYLADSSFIFLDFYGVSPTKFAWIFGAGVILLIAAHRVNHALLKIFKPRRILLYSIPLQTALIVLLFAYSQLDQPNMWLLYALIMSMTSVTQVINSNGLAIYLSLHPNHAGKANAILGSLRFGIGGIFGFLMAAIHSGHPRTFASIALVTALISMGLFFVCRTRSDIFALHNMH